MLFITQIDVKQIPSLIMKQVLKCHPMSIQNVRKYFSNPHSSSQRHLQRRSDANHKFLSSTSTSASLSPVKHSSLPYEEDTVTNDFLTFDQTPSAIVRRPSTPPSIYSTDPLCFSTTYGVDKDK